MNDDYNINNDDDLDEDLSHENLPAIDGQIGMEELFIREEQNESQEEEYIPPMENQISLEDFFEKDNVLKEKDNLLNNDNLGIFNNKRTEKIEDFFKPENEESLDDTSKNDNIKQEKNISNFEPLDNADYTINNGQKYILNNNFKTNFDDNFQENVDSENENDLPLSDLIGSELNDNKKSSNSAVLNESSEYGNYYRNDSLSQNEAVLGLNEGEYKEINNNNDIIDTNFNYSNKTKKEEGLSILEDNNNMNGNNNFGENNNQNYNNNFNQSNANFDNSNNNDYNQNYNNVNEENYSQQNNNEGDFNYASGNQNYQNQEDNNSYVNNDNYNQEQTTNENDNNQGYNNNTNDYYNNNADYNEINTSDGNDGVVNDFFGTEENDIENIDPTYGGSYSHEDAAFSVESNNDFEDNIENSLDKNEDNNDIDNYQNYSDYDKNDNDEIDNNYSDNSFSEDNAGFSEEENATNQNNNDSLSEDNSFENGDEDFGNNESVSNEDDNNYNSNENNNFNEKNLDNKTQTNFDTDSNEHNEVDNNDAGNYGNDNIDNYDNNDNIVAEVENKNIDNTNIINGEEDVPDSENNYGDNSNMGNISNNTYNENSSESDNKLQNKTQKENSNAKVKLNKKPNKQAKANLEYFENDENSKVIADVDNLNKDYEDVDLTVGKDAFADYESGSLVTGKIDENEVVDIREKIYNENSGQDVVDGMLYKNLDTVLHESMIPYSEHVILDRALPRVEDGLKPVQRRILYSMLELGVTPDKPYRKSARIVGDCLGKYHPHGDSSVYDAMVRMAQPFNTNMLLVSGHGNFGSVDGDGAAAMRYTEARLAPISMELLRDLDKNTVKWGLNFDDTLKEPEILPGRFPNLLVNGATGIAVGLATNIPPHNLAETIDGVVAYLNNPSITLKEMLKIIKGPDFPTGAYILNSSELFQAYQTGRGKIYLRAKMHIESNGNDKRYIVITELPYQVNKSSLLQKIANYKDEDKYGLGGISEVRDESDREGLRAVIRLKKDADLKAIYKSLLKNTELQTTFGINMVAIANGKPKQMGLLDIISYYAEYQREIIYRRSKYELEQAKEREHILSGLIIAIKNIDAVVKIIKTSQNTTEAKKRLKEKFNLSDRQAQAILDMRLAKLTSLEVYKLEEELKRLRELIQKLNAIISSKKLQKEIVKDEMLQIKRQYKQDRKTRFAKLEEDISSAPEPKEEANQKVVILKSVINNFKCVNIKQYNYAQKETTDNSTLQDTHILKFETETNNTLIAFSSLGNCFKVDVKDFTLSRYRDKGVPERSIFKELSQNETIVALFDYNITAKQGNFIFLTKYGMIKKTAYSEYSLLKKYYQGMKLKDDDEILGVYDEPKNYTYIFVTKQGMVLNAESNDVPLQGRISGGVKGINLANNDYCVGASLAIDGGEILAVTDKGFTKRVLVTNVDRSARYRKGLKFFTFTKDNGKELVFANVVTIPYTLGCVDNEGALHYRSTEHIPIESRAGKGKAVERMKKSLTIISAFAINN